MHVDRNHSWAKRYNNDSPPAGQCGGQNFTGRAVSRAAIEDERMLFGHNTNVTVGGVIVHVQTEDRGANRAVLDTTVHYRGRVLHRRTSRYDDLLPLDPDREHALKLRLDDQHGTVVDELRTGKLAICLASSRV